MTNFDDSDLMGDILSDENSDSFFEDPRVLAKRASLTKTPDKRAVSDLFGLDNDKPKDKPQNKESDWLGLGESTEEKPKTAEPLKSALSTERPPLQTTKSTKKISFEDDDNDILNTLGLDKKSETSLEVPKEREVDSGNKKMEPSKKSALMESIFGPPKQPELTSFEDILKESKVVKQRRDGSPTPSNQKSEATPRPATQPSPGYMPAEFTREGRRPRLQSSGSGVLDPLGLFGEPSVKSSELERPSSAISPTKGGKLPLRVIHGEGDAGTAAAEVLLPPKQKDLQTRSTPNIHKDLPDWLGEGSPVKTYKSDITVVKSAKPEQGRRTSIPRREVDVPAESVTTEQTDNSARNIDGPLDNPMLESLLTQQKFTTSHIEYQNTSIALQQQESQLLMALQLKKYEENLSDMQRKQQDILIKQEQQFNNLLERQFAKQQIMENNMRLQQERINSHIQLLIAQPPVSGRIDNEEQEELFQLKRTSAEENSRLYEEMIATLKQRQHEEIFLLNESYKKQISLLENSMEAVENLLKAEFTSLSDQFHETIGHVKKDHEAEIDKYKEKLKEMSTIHANEIKLIRENHNRIIEEIKYEYSTMVENMKQVKQTESSVLDNANTYTQKLDNSLEILDVNSKILNEIRGKVQHDYGVLSLAREESLKAREEEINMMRMTLEKSRESAETERAQLMGLVRSLEMKLMEQSQNAREERWALQQSAAVLTARSTAFDREIEFTHASLEREKEQLKTLRESMLAEQEKAILQLTEEKLALSAEKSRLETTAKLNQSYDSQKSRAEIDAAIQVANEAAELTDRERENLHRQLSQTESLKRSLLDKERKLALKEIELQAMFADADRKARDGERALMEAKALEAKYNARLRDIQGQLVSLTSREKKLAEDKIALSKERLALHNNLRQTKKCSLCASENIKPEDGNYAAAFVEQDFSPRMCTVTDPDILRLRYEITEERALAPKDVDES